MDENRIISIDSCNDCENELFDGSEYNKKLLYLTDNVDIALRLKADGRFVVPILSEKNSSFSFSDFKYVISNPEDISEDYYVKLWQRLSGKPWHILTTKRCRLREITFSDIPAIQKIYTHPSSTKFMAPFFPADTEPKEFVKNYINNVYSLFEFGTWIVERQSDNQIIGLIGFNYREDFSKLEISEKSCPLLEHPELGFIIDAPHRHMGYAYEVCRAAMDYGMSELGFKKVYAIAHPHNIPSVKVLKKLGFENFGTDNFIWYYKF